MTCVLLSAFWARSYFYFESLSGPLPLVGARVGLASWRGQIGTYWMPAVVRDSSAIEWPPDLPAPEHSWIWSTTAAREHLALLRELNNVGIATSTQSSFLGFSISWRENEAPIEMPFWFPLVVCALLVCGLKPKPRLRFSLRDLLVAVTLTAVILSLTAGLVARF
jgi:hypothetical protein